MGEHPFHIGMIGAGGIARSRHIPGLKKVPGVRLVAVANRSPESGRKAREEFGFEKSYERWQDVVNDPEVNIVFVCTPPYLHREISCYALARGKHVFCQARMAVNLAEARVMLEADRQTKLTTMLCPPPHYMTVEPYVRKLLADGGLGEIRHVELSHTTATFLDPAAPLHWRQRKDLQGINMLDVGITGEVLNKWFGSLDKLSAKGRTWVPSRPKDRDGRSAVELPDAVTVIGSFESGATFTGLFAQAVNGGRSMLGIFGSEGTLLCDANENFVLLRKGKNEERIDIPPELRGKWTVEEDFLRAVAEGRKGTPSFADGVRYMAFTQAVYDSLEKDMEPVRVARLQDSPV
jgi:predicted dehydrogenase